MPNRAMLFVMCIVAVPSFAQEDPKPPSWMPKSFPAYFDFSNVSIARISADKKTVQVVRPKIESATRIRTISKVVMNAETRTRAVTVEGKEKTQTYTVQVPSTVQEEQAYVVQFPKGYEKFDVAMDAISATDLAGNAIDATTLAARLQKPTHVLAMEGRLASIDPYYLNVMRTDTIVIFVPQGTIDKPKAAGTEIPSPPVPAVPVPAAPAPKAS